MRPRYLGSQTGQEWQQIAGREQHRYARVIVFWGDNLRLSSDETARWDVPPPVEFRYAVEVR